MNSFGFGTLTDPDVMKAITGKEDLIKNRKPSQ